MSLLNPWRHSDSLGYPSDFCFSSGSTEGAYRGKDLLKEALKLEGVCSGEVPQPSSNTSSWAAATTASGKQTSENTAEAAPVHNQAVEAEQLPPEVSSKPGWSFGKDWKQHRLSQASSLPCSDHPARAGSLQVLPKD